MNPETDLPNPALDLAEYQALREATRKVHDLVLGSATRADFTGAAHQLGLLSGKVIEFENDSEQTVLADFMVYSWRPNGVSLIEIHQRLNGARLDAATRELLGRMVQARYRLLRIESVHGQGQMWVDDVLTRQRLVLVDRGMAGSAEAGYGLAGHVIEFDGFCILTGAALPVDRAVIQRDDILRALAAQPSRKISAAVLNAKCARLITAALIRAGYAGQVAFDG
jgi:hypothetical protein